MVRTPADFIRNDLGGAQAVADRLGMKASSVRMWVHRNRVPRSAWPEILEAYKSVKLKDLRAIEQAGRDAA